MTALPKFDTLSLSKALIGADRIFDTFESRFANQITSNYPPHNIIIVDDNKYMIEMAIAGFAKSEIKVEVQQDQLAIHGVKEGDEDTSIVYQHKGISARNFTKHFSFASPIVVKSAVIDNGILSVSLERFIPEELKVRTIEIQDKNSLTAS